MNDIPLVGWILIIFLVLFVIVINFILITFLRNPTKIKMEHKPGQTAESLRKLNQAIRDPMADERKQLDELSRLVEKLKDQDPK